MKKSSSNSAIVGNRQTSNNKQNPVTTIKQTNSKMTRIVEKEESKENVRDEEYGEEKIIQKVMKKGLESLTLEEMAVTAISPNFESDYLLKTGNEWTKENKAKVIERLNYAKFNINWNTSSNSTMKAPFAVLFELVERGDITRVTEYLRKNAQYNEELLACVDKNKKSPIHIASKCGHTNLVQVLLSRGYSVHMRDKFLRTPLHTACQYSRGTVAELLIKSSSDIYARDSIGRTCIHFAASANSVELIVLLLGLEPELVHSKDTYGRTPLHYVVWNSNILQPEIARKLIDAGAVVDALDDENMTPLHYASDAGKAKIIPLLLKNGANPFLRNGRTHRTALEMALTQHIKEIIIVYSGKPYTVGKEDLNDMKITGEKIDPSLQEQDVKQQRPKSKPKNLQTINEVKESVEVFDQKNMNDFLFKSQKDKLVAFLKNIQEYGVKSLQHLTKPSLYSGSWLENINNVEELYNNLNSCSSSEAVLRIFNIISPYNHAFPQGKGQESEMAYFFNEKEKRKPESKLTDCDNFVVDNTKRDEIDNIKEEIKELKRNLNNADVNNNKNNENNRNNEYILELKNIISRLENDNTNLKLNNEKLIDNIKSLTDNISSYKMTIEESKRKEELSKKQIDNLNTQIKEMRQELSKIQENEKRTIRSTLSNNIGFGIKTITENDSRDLSLNDEKSIYIFIKLIEDKSLGLDVLLTKYDKDNDLHIFKNEMLNLLEEINLPVEDRHAVMKLSGFNDTKLKMPIKIIIDNIYKREERKHTKLNELLFKVAYILHNKFIDLEKVNEFLKINEEKSLNINELKQGFNSLEIFLIEVEVETLFRCLSINDQNKIYLDELIEKLRIRKTILDEIGNIGNKIRYNLKNVEENNNISKQDDVSISDKSNKEFSEKEKPLENSSLNYINIVSNHRIAKKEELVVSDFNEKINNSQANIEEEAAVVITGNTGNNSGNELRAESEIDEEIMPDKKDTIDSNQKKVENYIKKPSADSINPKTKDSNSTSNPKQIKKKVPLSEGIPSNKKINGELKIQVKNVENLLLPSSLSKPYTLFLKGSLKGVDIEVDSKDIYIDNLKKADFNWATRIMIKNKTLAEVGSLFKLELYTRTKFPIVIGECMLNWTTTLQAKNVDTFSINDRFQLLSKRMSNVGIIAVQVKFIPFGSVNSLYDKNGKRNKIPNSLKGLLNSQLMKTDKLEEKSVNSFKTENNEALTEIEEKITTKTVSVEITNISDKHYLGKENLYLSVSNPEDNSEIYSTKENEEKFSESIKNLPFNFNFQIQSSNKAEFVNFNVFLIDYSGVEDVVVGKIDIKIENKNLEVVNKYPLVIVKKSYFKLNKNKATVSGNIEFFMKINMEEANVLEGEDQANQEENNDVNDVNNENEIKNLNNEENNNEEMPPNEDNNEEMPPNEENNEEMPNEDNNEVNDTNQNDVEEFNENNVNEEKENNNDEENFDII